MITFENLNLSNKNINFIEIFYNPKQKISPSDTLCVFDVNLTEEKFRKTLQNYIEESSRKPFEKQHYIQKHQDIISNYEYNDKKQTVYKKSLEDFQDFGENFCLFSYNKSNLAPIYFPSTTDIVEEFNINRISFMINNRIYLNFEVKTYYDNKKTADNKFSIYMNINLDKKNNLDINNLISLVNATLKDLE